MKVKFSMCALVFSINSEWARCVFMDNAAFICEMHIINGVIVEKLNSRDINIIMH